MIFFKKMTYTRYLHKCHIVLNGDHSKAIRNIFMKYGIWLEDIQM